MMLDARHMNVVDQPATHNSGRHHERSPGVRLYVRVTYPSSARNVACRYGRCDTSMEHLRSISVLEGVYR